MLGFGAIGEFPIGALPAAGGGINLTQSARFDNNNTFFGHAITPGAIALTATRYDNTNQFFGVTLTAGTVALTASRLDNTNQFFAHEIASGGMAAARLNNANTFFAHSIGLGAVSLQAGRVDNANTFFGHNVAPGQIQLAASLWQNQNQFFGASLESIYTINLTGAQAKRLDAVLRLHGLIDPLVVTATGRGDGTVTQTFTGTLPIIVETVAMTSTPNVTPELLDKLARWADRPHGRARRIPL